LLITRWFSRRRDPHEATIVSTASLRFDLDTCCHLYLTKPGKYRGRVAGPRHPLGPSRRIRPTNDGIHPIADRFGSPIVTRAPGRSRSVANPLVSLWHCANPLATHLPPPSRRSPVTARMARGRPFRLRRRQAAPPPLAERFFPAATSRTFFPSMIEQLQSSHRSPLQSPASGRRYRGKATLRLSSSFIFHASSARHRR
jgi:hypothetical protein